MSYIYKVKSFSTQKPKDHITLSYFNFRRMCESWKLSDSLLTVCCRCGFVSVDSLLSRGRWEQVRCRPNPGTPIKINLVLSLVLSPLSGGLGMSLYSPTVYNPHPQLSSPCNLTWIVWLWDVLKINNKMWQELDTFTNTEEKLFWLKPQNHIYYLLPLQHCTRWEHISFCCVNHACMFSMFWKFMGESFFEYTAKKCQNIKLFTMRYRENSSARVLKCERVGTWPCLALNHWKSLTSRFQSVKLCSNN